MISETLRGPRLAATTSTASSRYGALSDRRSALTLARGVRPNPTLAQIDYPLGAAYGFAIASGMFGPSRRCAETNGPSLRRGLSATTATDAVIDEQATHGCHDSLHTKSAAHPMSEGGLPSASG